MNAMMPNMAEMKPIFQACHRPEYLAKPIAAFRAKADIRLHNPIAAAKPPAKPAAKTPYRAP